MSLAQLPRLDDIVVGIIGLGYVGLPLAIEFGKSRSTVGFDIDSARIAELRSGYDCTGESTTEDLTSAESLAYSDDISDLEICNVFIIAVPTPIDIHHQPNLRPLLAASDTVGRVLKRGDIVVYESTVYPGATEEDCLPVVERTSGLKFNSDFFAGYSPERINPGDKSRPLPSIVKITSGSNDAVANLVDALYRTIITAGTYKAANIKVAEAAKVIENTQRDVNIALINELSIIFSHLNIDTTDVLNAAATKWNFMRLNPGLVGGHCIGVDPYYLVHKSMSVGHIPDIMRHSREINDSMPRHAASLLVRRMIAKGLRIKAARVLLLGFTFKENCSDIRNTKMIDLIDALESYFLSVDICDTWASASEVAAHYDRDIQTQLPTADKSYDAVILGVAHEDIISLGADSIKAFLCEDGVFFDMRSAFDKSLSDIRL